MNSTAIEWTDFSCTPLKMRMPDGALVNACAKVSQGCQHCYAESYVRRFWKKAWGPFPGYTPALLRVGTPHLVESELAAVLRLSQRIAAGKADPAKNKIFWNDMTDEFLEFWPDEFRDRLFAVRALTPNLIHQVLTKRADRMADYLATPGLHNRLELAADVLLPGKGHPSFGGKHMLPSLPLPNVHLGVSVENQAAADERIPHLLRTPAAVRFLSAEPLLGPVDLRPKAPDAYAILGKFYGTGTFDPSGMSPAADRVLNCFPKIDWVIVGAESSSRRREMKDEWALSLLGQCRAAGVKFFMKQMAVGGKVTGEMADFPEALRVRQFPEVAPAVGA